MQRLSKMSLDLDTVRLDLDKWIIPIVPGLRDNYNSEVWGIQHFDPCGLLFCELESSTAGKGLSWCTSVLYLIHFTRRGINNLDMTKWKQPSNGITAVIAPWGSFWAPPLPLLGSGEPSSVFLRPFMCLSPSTIQYRYAKLEQPSQFGGEPCNFHGTEEEACAVSARYTCDNVPLCEGFLCTQTGISNAHPHILCSPFWKPI